MLKALKINFKREIVKIFSIAKIAIFNISSANLSPGLLPKCENASSNIEGSKNP